MERPNGAVHPLSGRAHSSVKDRAFSVSTDGESSVAPSYFSPVSHAPRISDA